MKYRSLRQRTLLRALEILGDERSLADKLRVPRAELRLWLKGVESPPTQVFLAAVDIVEYCVPSVDYGVPALLGRKEAV